MAYNPTTYLYLVRHGESDLNTIPGTFGGQQNKSPLTDKGRAQAARVGRFMNKLGLTPDEAYSSEAVRGYDTGVLALKAAGIILPIRKTPALLELDRGAWTGRRREEIVNDPKIQEEMERLGMNYKPKGGESMRDGFTRIMNWANGVRRSGYTSENPQRVIAFTHSNIIGCFIAAVAGRERHYTDSIPVGYGSMSIFSSDGNKWRSHMENMNTQT